MFSSEVLLRGQRIVGAAAKLEVLEGRRSTQRVGVAVVDLEAARFTTSFAALVVVRAASGIAFEHRTTHSRRNVPARAIWTSRRRDGRLIGALRLPRWRDSRVDREVLFPAFRVGGVDREVRVPPSRVGGVDREVRVPPSRVGGVDRELRFSPFRVGRELRVPARGVDGVGRALRFSLRRLRDGSGNDLFARTVCRRTLLPAKLLHQRAQGAKLHFGEIHSRTLVAEQGANLVEQVHEFLARRELHPVVHGAPDLFGVPSVWIRLAVSSRIVATQVGLHHLMLWHLMLWHLVLWHLVLWHLVLWHLVLWHLVLWHLVLWHSLPRHPIRRSSTLR